MEALVKEGKLLKTSASAESGAARTAVQASKHRCVSPLCSCRMARLPLLPLPPLLLHCPVLARCVAAAAASPTAVPVLTALAVS